jgi:hypothetical protein
VWFGGPIDSATATLRVVGKDVDPTEISQLLKCDPTAAARTGEVIKSNGIARTVREGFWRLDSARDAKDIEDQIVSLLTQVTDDLDVWRLLIKRFRVDMFCGLFLDAQNRGFELTPQTLRQLADRGIAIGFDIYVPD